MRRGADVNGAEWMVDRVDGGLGEDELARWRREPEEMLDSTDPQGRYAASAVGFMQHRPQQLWQWAILAIAIAIPLVVGVHALLRLRTPSDLVSGVGNGLIVLLCALV